MADKEATVFIVDLAHSMSKTRNGRQHSDLDWSLQWIEDKLSNIVASGRKTLAVGVLGLGTDETANEMKDEEGYDHISELQSLQSMSLQTLRDLRTRLKPSRNEQRDLLSAVILGVDMLLRFCGKLKWKKKIVLVTNGTGPTNPDEQDILSTAEQMQARGIEFLILGIDFDDAEFGFKEEDKSTVKASNEKLLRKLANASGGSVGTMAEAIEGLAIPYIKSVRPTPTFRGKLCLGNSSYDTAVAIDVERYFKVSAKRPPTASSYILRGDVSEQGNLQTVESGISYQVPDLEEPSGFKELARDDLAKGYEYGRTAVHIAESDENITKLETDSGYDILGFIPKDNVERYLVLDNTNMLVAAKGNDKASLGLSSVVRALYEIDSVAIARFVKKDMAEPQLTLLTPFINDEIECLIENILPFAEDLRQYRFPPLDKVVTISGKSLVSHRNLPDDKLLSAMSDFVDGLSLEDGADDITIEETFSPINYAIEHAIKRRALHMDSELPLVPEGLLAHTQQSNSLQEQTVSALDRLTQSADVKKVPPKAKGRKRYREAEKPLSGLNVEDLLKKEARTKITPQNAIPEFKQALDHADKDTQVVEAVNQMTSIIRDRIKDTFGDSYDRVLAELGELRQELQEFEFPHMYNATIHTLKKEILAEKLGGNRKMLWYKIKISRLGLIDHDECKESNITHEQAEEFLRTN